MGNPQATVAEKGYQSIRQRALAALGTLQSADIVIPTTDGRQIPFRRITQPTEEEKHVLVQLDMDLPRELQISQQCSANFASY